MADDRRPMRFRPALVAGAGIGLALGLALGYFGRAPLFGSSLVGYAIYPLAVGLFVTVVLIARVVRGSPTASATLIAVWVFGVVGVAVAPLPPGASTGAGGAVRIGTASDPTAHLSAPARCQWMTGAPYVDTIADFTWHVSDPTLQATLDLAGPLDVVRIFLGTGSRPIGDAMLEFGPGQESRSGSFTALPMSTVAPDGRSGTARSADGSIVVSWTCDGGPR